MHQIEYVTYSDGQSAVDLRKNFMYNARKEQIDVRYHWIQDQVERESLQVKKIHTSENPANTLTKVILRDRFELCKELLGMSSI